MPKLTAPGSSFVWFGLGWGFVSLDINEKYGACVTTASFFYLLSLEHFQVTLIFIFGTM